MNILAIRKRVFMLTDGGYLLSEHGLRPSKATFGVALPPNGQSWRGKCVRRASLSTRVFRHPQEAVALVRFLCRRDVELERARITARRLRCLNV